MPCGIGLANASSASSRVREKQGSSTKQPNLPPSASIAETNEVCSSSAIEQRVINVSKHDRASSDSSRVNVPQTLCHLTDPGSQSTAKETGIKSKAKKASPATKANRTSVTSDAFLTTASENANLRHSPKEWYGSSKVPASVVRKRALSEPLLVATKSRNLRRARKASSAGSLVEEQPAAATSAASAASIAADDRAWKLASGARIFIRSREKSSSASGQRNGTADVMTSRRSGSLSLDTSLIIELQKLTSEAAIRDMIQQIEQSMALAVNVAESEMSTSTTTITLPVKPPTNTSTCEESLSKPMSSSTINTRIPATTGDTSQFTSSKKGSTPRECTSATTSSTGESSSATGKTESAFYPLCLRAKVVAVVTVILLVLVGLVLILRLNPTRRSLARSSQERRDLSSVCNNPACHRALVSLLEPVDSDVSPCEDFYRHVCGRWRARNPKRQSYAVENHRSFLMGIHRRLARHYIDGGWNGSDMPQNHGGCERRNRLIAAFYASCLHFGRRPSVPSLQAMLSRIGVDSTSWLNSENFLELLARVVAASLRSGLASAISVRRSRDGHSIFIEVGDTLKHNLDNGYYDIADGVSTGRPRCLLTACFNIHPGLIDFLSRHSLILHDIKDRLLSFRTAQSNAEFLTNFDEFPHFKVPRNLSFYVRGLIEVGEVLRALGDWREPGAVNLYTLLVPAAQLFAYVRPWLVSRNDREDTVIPACLRATERRFLSQFASLLAGWTETTLARLYFRDMVSTLRRTLKIPVPHKHDGTRDGADANVEFEVVTIVERNQSELACRTEDLFSTFLSMDDFIGNLILLFKKERFISAERPHTHIAEDVKGGSYQLRSSLVSSVSGAGHMVFVPPLYLSRDLLHAEASEPSLDIPTVGVPILTSWARSMMSTGKDEWSTTAALYGSCVRKNHPLDHALSDRASDEALLTNALLVPWAIRVALTARATMTTKEYNASGYGHSTSPTSTTANSDSEDSLRTQVFFRRLCLVECGDPVGAPACIYATSHSPEFADAFGCPKHMEPAGHHPCSDILKNLAARLTSISGNITLTQRT
ncbi:hypothetical protein HPB51_017099 [Rhipicephalus microplus]|uniref:Peptidase M13 N-terminal domain-containing protein n=1 Tax=Rhipicephalus microplus TaxID=6941 RepID=A0A9J6DWF7_RHIMP|nr:hypothetical protein HPB51_017099 [Rhipicephalus microplus]